MRKTFENFNSRIIIEQLCAFMSITFILSLNKNLLNRVYTAYVTNFIHFFCEFQYINFLYYFMKL